MGFDLPMDVSLLSKYVEDGIETYTPPAKERILSVLPVPNMVLIPGTVLPIEVSDPVIQQMIEELLSSGTSDEVLVSFSPRGRDRRMMMSSICGVGRVIAFDQLRNGRKAAIVEGDYRVEIVHFVEDRSYLRARARFIPDSAYSDPARVSEMHHSFLGLVKKWLFLMGHVPSDYAALLSIFKYPHHLADFIAGYFLPDYTLKQQLLETRDCEKRVQMVEEILLKGIEWFSRHSPLASEKRPSGSWMN